MADSPSDGSDNLAHRCRFPHGAGAHKRTPHQTHINERYIEAAIGLQRDVNDLGLRCHLHRSPETARHRSCSEADNRGLQLLWEDVVGANRQRYQRHISPAFGYIALGAITAERDHCSHTQLTEPCRGQLGVAAGVPAVRLQDLHRSRGIKSRQRPVPQSRPIAADQHPLRSALERAHHSTADCTDLDGV